MVNDYSLDCTDKNDYSSIEAACEELLLAYTFYPPQGRLGFSKPCITAFERALEICPTYEVKHEASLRAIVQAVNADKAAGYRGASFQDASYLAKLFAVLGDHGHLYRTPAGEAEERKLKAQAADEVEKSQLIAKILNGKSVYPIIAYGQTKAASGDHLPKESTERLREILAEVTKVRELKKETRAEQRDRLREASEEAGIGLRPKRDSLDGIAPSGNAPTQQVSSTQPYGNQDHIFRVNPESPDSPYLNRAQLLNIAKHDRNRWRLLMASDLNLLNKLLGSK